MLWRRICSIFTGDSQIPESFLIRVREDEQMTEGLHDLLLTGFFDDLMETIKDSNVIFKWGLGYKRVKSCSSFYANLKRMKSFFESFVRIYGDMLNKTVLKVVLMPSDPWSMVSRPRTIGCPRNTMSPWMS